MNKYPLIRKIYLYLFALVGLLLVTVGAVRLVSLGLKTYVFQEADQFYSYPSPRLIEQKTPDGKELQEPSKEEIEEFERKQRTSNRQREAAESLGWIIVGIPLYLYHWRQIQKDKMGEMRDEK